MGKQIFLIDGHSLLNRAFYALPRLTSADGRPTNAVYGFTMMLFRLMEDYKPDGIFVAFDVSAPTFRHKQYAEYKATRKGMPDDLRPQVGMLKEVLDALGIPRLEIEGYEADDVIGTAARYGEELGYQVFVVTGDKDSLQLISKQTNVILTKKGIKEIEQVDLDTLQDEYQLTPDQVRDLKGLMGDSSDNIRGVPGVGLKTAMKLLNQYSNLENLYENIDDQKGKLRERLVENKEQAFFSRELATIDCDVPLDMDLTREPNPDHAQVYQLFTELEFKTLLNKLTVPQEVRVAQEVQARHSDFEVIKLSQDTCEQFKSLVRQSKVVGIDYNTVGDGIQTSLVSLAIAIDGKVYYMDTNADDRDSAWLWEILSQQIIYTREAKSLFLATDNCKLAEQVVLDTTVAGYLLDPSAGQDLATLSKRYSNLADLPETEDHVLALAHRAYRVWELGDDLLQALKDRDLEELYYQVELPLVWVITRMEKRGILVDPKALTEMSAGMEAALEQLTKEIYQAAGEEFNINSPKQLGTILFDKLGLPVLKKTKTGPSTSAEVLEQLSDHPIVASLLEYRQVAKLKSTYADALCELISPTTERIHSTFNQTVTATGRLSSTNPNLQNIPIKTEAGRNIRKAFISQPGYYLLAADYSQIELRVLAHISEDMKLIEAFKNHQDIHTQTAAEVFGLRLEEVTAQERSAAKAINFGIVYGISSFGLAKGTNLSRNKAQEYIDGYFARYPKVKQYLDNAVKQAKREGYVTTILNRRRYLPEINSQNFARRSFAERTAMNTPIQGSAADIIKLAMLRVEEALVGHKSRLLLQVHDELVLEVEADELNSVAQIVKQEMEQVIELVVPLEVDIMVGKNWRDVSPYNLDEVK